MKRSVQFSLAVDHEMHEHGAVEHTYIVIASPSGDSISVKSVEDLEALRDMLAIRIPLIKKSLKKLTHETE